MTKHTEKAGALPNASIDFDKVHANAKAGKDDVYKGTLSKQRGEPAPDAGEAEEKTADVISAAPQPEEDER
jgi:hypothetical protein